MSLETHDKGNILSHWPHRKQEQNITMCKCMHIVFMIQHLYAEFYGLHSRRIDILQILFDQNLIIPCLYNSWIRLIYYLRKKWGGVIYIPYCLLFFQTLQIYLKSILLYSSLTPNSKQIKNEIISIILRRNKFCKKGKKLL